MGYLIGNVGDYEVTGSNHAASNNLTWIHSVILTVHIQGIIMKSPKNN